MRLIDADRLLRPDMIRMCYHLPNGDIAMPIGDIKHAPTVDAAPVVHGQWIHLDQEESTISGKCSCCGWEAHYYEDDVAGMPYCPNCGARMDLEEQDAQLEQSGK